VSDYFMVIGVQPTESEDVQGAAQVFVATGNNEEEAVAKVAVLDPDAELFIAQVVPTFPPPEPAP
jgi:hypothetical protein